MTGVQTCALPILDELHVALRHLQHLDPPGVGARNLGECLKLQLELLPETTPHRTQALEIVTHHLDVLAARDDAPPWWMWAIWGDLPFPTVVTTFDDARAREIDHALSALEAERAKLKGDIRDASSRSRLAGVVSQRLDVRDPSDSMVRYVERAVVTGRGKR